MAPAPVTPISALPFRALLRLAKAVTQAEDGKKKLYVVLSTSGRPKYTIAGIVKSIPKARAVLTALGKGAAKYQIVGPINSTFDPDDPEICPSPHYYWCDDPNPIAALGNPARKDVAKFILTIKFNDSRKDQVSTYTNDVDALLLTNEARGHWRKGND